METLRTNFQWYLENQESLIQSYNGKFLVIKDSTVVASFDTDYEALKYATAHFEQGSFIIQKCTAGEKDYSQTFHSRVIFA